MCEAPWIVERRHPLFYVTISGRIMSCSSCSRMWQCHTYSWPPVRGLKGSPMDAGKFGKLNCMITVVASPGFIRTVSFQPISLASGGMASPMKRNPAGRITGECLSLDDLDVDQVEMDRMGVPGEVEELPDFDRAGARVLRGRCDVRLPPGWQSLVIRTAG